MDGKDGGKKRRVAIACQGGGSHTAFTAGALKRLLAEGRKDYEFVAFSGTSGGAICALLAWYALLKGEGERGAAALLDSFWLRDNAANTLPERLWNDWLVQSLRWQHETGLLVEGSPNALSDLARDQLRRSIERNVGFGEIDERLVAPHSPQLFAGAVDVITGDFKVFRSHKKRSGDDENGAHPGFVFNDDPGEGIGVEAMLASAAIPPIFKAMRIGDGVYWDGLYSQNPPMRDLPDALPDEIWVIQINPKGLVPRSGGVAGPRDAPGKIANITDRRNELAGNLALYQEIRFINKINELLDNGLLAEGGKYRRIEVRPPIENLKPLDYATKLDRSPGFLRGMMAYGEQQAQSFLDGLPET